MRHGAVAGLLALGLWACQNGGIPQTQFCQSPFGIGPDGTDGICNLGSMCVPSTIAKCDSNNCCHVFCAIGGCGSSNNCVSLTPEEIPDGGAPGCACTDAGGCVCAGAGFPCYRSTCLGVCSDPS